MRIQLTIGVIVAAAIFVTAHSSSPIIQTDKNNGPAVAINDGLRLVQATQPPQTQQSIVHIALAECPLNQDTRDCRTPECQLRESTRNCAQPRDRRECSACIVRSPRICFFGKCSGGECIQMGNDPTCEVQKAAQNQIYDANQAACEVAKEAEVAGYQGEFAACQADGQRLRAQCESEKAAQNAAYTIQRQTCEAHRDQVVKCVAQALGVDAISASCIGCIEGAESADVSVCIYACGTDTVRLQSAECH